MYIQGVNHFKDIKWTDDVTYGQVHLEDERQFTKYNFDIANTEMNFASFNFYEAEVRRCIDAGLVLPAYDFVLKCSHAFNMLDARGAISVTERQAYIKRVRDLARLVAKNYVEFREQLGYPLLKKAQ